MKRGPAYTDSNITCLRLSDFCLFTRYIIFLTFFLCNMLICFRSIQMEQVAAVNTSAGSEGWLELNVTSALAAWLSSPADNRGFFITLHPHSQPGTYVYV